MANDEFPPELPPQVPPGKVEEGLPDTSNVVGFDQVEEEPVEARPRNRRFHPGGAGVGEDSPPEGFDPAVLKEKIEAVADDVEPSVRFQTGYTGRPTVTPTKRSRPQPLARRPIQQILAERELVVRAAPEVVEATVTDIKTKLAAKGSPTDALEIKHRAEQAAKDLIDSPRTPAPSAFRGRPYIPHPRERDKNDEIEE